MNESVYSNTPTMTDSEWRKAPWNEDVNKPVELEVTASYSLSKPFVIVTDDYDKVMEPIDDDTNQMSVFPDFSNSNLEKAFENDNDVYGIDELLKEFVVLLKEKISSLKKSNETADEAVRWQNTIMINKYENLLASASGWTIDEMCVEQ